MIERIRTGLAEMADSLSCEITRTANLDGIMFTGQDGKRFIVSDASGRHLLIERETGNHMTIFKAWQIVMCADDYGVINEDRRRWVEDDAEGLKTFAEELVEMAYNAREGGIVTRDVTSVIEIYEEKRA